MAKLTATEEKCLRLLADAFYDPDFCVLCTEFFENRLDLTRLQARRAIKSLVRQGLAARSPIWDDSDNKVRGSGYIVTAVGALEARRAAA